MGLTTAMYTALSGLQVNQTRIETIGNNIANVNTTAYKGSRTLFQTQFSRTLSLGTPPGETSGGTNPTQVGLGAMIGSTQRNTNSGSLETTGIASDMAVDGAGYFMVQTPAGRVYYTRDGSFTLNSVNQLVTQDGYYLQGYGVDENYQVVPGQLQNLEIPLGRMSIARATENVSIDGDLSAAETIATSGSEHNSQPLVNGGGAAATAATQLTDVRAAATPGAVLFADGDVITVSGAARGGRALQSEQFTVGVTGNTLGDFAAWLQDTLGIQTDASLSGSPGVTIEGGALVIRGNTGEPNAIEISGNDLTSTNASVSLPLQFTQINEAVGTGVFTSFTVYDSLGNAVPVNATFTLEETPDTGPVWRYYLESAASDGTPQSYGTGTLAFDTAGNFVSATGNQLAIDRTGTGAAATLNVTIDFSGLNGQSTSVSNVLMADQDGYPPGTLSGYGVGMDGTVTGIFSNGLSRTLGQVALATFANDGGLVAEANNLYSTGANSGPAAVTTAGSLGAGLIQNGTLELSNVDLSSEFIGLITCSTGYQAASRVITVSNEMLDQLLMALR